MKPHDKMCEPRPTAIRWLALRWIAVAASFALTVPALVPATGGQAAERIPGPVIASVVKVIDGDTLVVRARIWLGQDVETRVRLQGVDTPELAGACERERLLALRARDFIRLKIGDAKVVMRDIRYGKYAGRVIARILTADGEDSSAALIEAGLGRPYHGGRRASWCIDDDGP